MNRRTFFKITAVLTALCSGVKVFALQPKTNLDKVNVRRLVLEIKKYINSIPIRYIFRGNDEEVRESCRREIERYLEDIKSRKGVYNYQVVCNESNNPPINLEEGRLNGTVVIQPTKTVEWIVLYFSVIPTTLKRNTDYYERYPEEYNLTGFDYVYDPLPGYEIKDV